MKELPVTIRQRPLKCLLKSFDGPARLRRPADGMYKALKPGDRLWLREAFRLEKLHDLTSPTGAAAGGAQPVFEADRDAPPCADSVLGNTRAAYTLLRAWSRYHFIVSSVERESLLDITEEEARADGFSSRQAWLEDWDSMVGSLTGGRSINSVNRNPAVLVIEAKLIRAPLDQRPKEAAE